MKLRSRLLVYVTALLTFAMSCAIIAATISFSQAIRKSADSTLDGEARFLAARLPRMNSEDTIATLDSYAENLDIRITIVNENGIVTYDSEVDPSTMDNHLWREEIQEALSTGSGVSSRSSGSMHTPMLYRAVKTTDSNGDIRIVRTSAPLVELIAWRSVFYTLLIPLLLVFLVIAVLFTILMLRYLTRPIEQLAATAHEYHQGNLLVRSSIEGPEELAELSATMNSMAKELAARISQLERDKQQYSSILSSMSEGLLLVDSRNIIVLSNNAANTMLGKGFPEAQSLVGAKLSEIFTDDDFLKLVATTMHSGKVGQTSIVKYKHLTGQTASLVGAGREQTFQVSTAIVPGMQEESGKAVTGGILITFTDITELKRLEQVRKDFVANVSHELKTPLTAINGFSETLLGGMISSEDIGLFSKIINRNARQMQGIIDDLLLLASLEDDHAALTMKRCTLEELVKETCEDTSYRANSRSVILTTTVHDENGRGVMVNPSLLVQALVNLVINAITYSEPGSEVRIKAEGDQDTVTFSVMDQGSGIPEKHLTRIFERFYRVDKARSRNQGGTGLGLSIVKHVVSMHGGQVSVQSVENLGSTFTITIPREQKFMQSFKDKSELIYGQLPDINEKE
ncbi:ATP-binding protein [Parasphaerochaeta coccoides]|uniref:histidine kinase n=1 Tax=Parasphaerochaeta coccoides (strain ATCC BAA-1237 / DSM 17374 / SPN1) TaxID=760011 RepID=F4GIE2_PARC1|nr:ATP-binding protein [Parasphaerochaeta coccoides]AEC01650.1 multi-sensor signal transduction histidine kinase [Parasphaerochaeta coccoides DSM 17374]